MKYHYLIAITLLALVFYLSSLSIAADTAIPTQYQVKLSAAEKQYIAHKIWLNEGAGKKENLMVWNKGENFPSLGIGHFIWFPKNLDSPYTESFPSLLAELQNHPKFPKWLNPSSDSPWSTRKEFKENLTSARSKQIQQLLSDTFIEQLDFIINRMEESLPKILLSINNSNQREHVKRQFYRVANEPNGIYALIDYVNFKGEGTSAKEKYQSQGWGLLQVLERMDPDNQDIILEFVNSAKYVLKRRTKNSHRNEAQWLQGWNKRLDTYLVYTRND